MLGLALFYVGAVLCLNGLWLIGRIGDKEIAVIDVFVGGITLLVALSLAFTPGADLASIKGAALLLLFTFTYFWVALNRYNGADGRGLGWVLLVRRRQQVFPINKSLVALNLLTNLRFVLEEH